MNKELNEDARTKQDLLYECSSLESKLSDEIVKSEHLEQQCKKQKEVIDKASSQIKLYGKYNGEKCTRGFSMMTADFNKLLDILKEVE